MVVGSIPELGKTERRRLPIERDTPREGRGRADEIESGTKFETKSSNPDSIANFISQYAHVAGRHISNGQRS